MDLNKAKIFVFSLLFFSVFNVVFSACPNQCFSNPCPFFEAHTGITDTIIKWCGGSGGCVDRTGSSVIIMLPCTPPSDYENFNAQDWANYFQLTATDGLDYDKRIDKEWRQDVNCHCYLITMHTTYPSDVTVTKTWSGSVNILEPGTYRLTCTWDDALITVNGCTSMADDPAISKWIDVILCESWDYTPLPSPPPFLGVFYNNTQVEDIYAELEYYTLKCSRGNDYDTPLACGERNETGLCPDEMHEEYPQWFDNNAGVFFDGNNKGTEVLYKAFDMNKNIVTFQIRDNDKPKHVLGGDDPLLIPTTLTQDFKIRWPQITHLDGIAPLNKCPEDWPSSSNPFFERNSEGCVLGMWYWYFWSVKDNHNENYTPPGGFEGTEINTLISFDELFSGIPQNINGLFESIDGTYIDSMYIDAPDETVQGDQCWSAWSDEGDNPEFNGGVLFVQAQRIGISYNSNVRLLPYDACNSFEWFQFWCVDDESKTGLAGYRCEAVSSTQSCPPLTPTPTP